ncbi:hypothetical protein MRX96_015307 [Rhipicephalus microplus]
MGFEPTWAGPNGLAVHRLNLSATSPALQAIRAAYTLVSKTDHWENKKKLRDSTRIRLEPMRAEPNKIAVYLLNHSALSSALLAIHAVYTLVSQTHHWEDKKKIKRLDEDRIRTQAGRAQWISSPSP